MKHISTETGETCRLCNLLLLELNFPSVEYLRHHQKLIRIEESHEGVLDFDPIRAIHYQAGSIFRKYGLEVWEEI